MNGLKVDENSMNRIAEKIRIREETGVNPETMNQTVAALDRFPQSLRSLKEQLCRTFGSVSMGPGGCSVLDEFEQSYGLVKNNTMDWMIQHMITTYNNHYLRKRTPNFSLPYAEVMAEAKKLCEARGFDAYALEDLLLSYIRQASEIALRATLEATRRILPSPAVMRGILEKNVLHLKGGVHKTGPRLEYFPNFDTVAGLEALDKLSRIILDRSDAAAVESPLCRQLARTPLSASDLETGFGIRDKESPIRKIKFCRENHVTVEYANPKAAAEIAKVLLFAKPSNERKATSVG